MCIELDFKGLYSFNLKALFDRNEYSFIFLYLKILFHIQ